jgi:hypothetical protein
MRGRRQAGDPTEDVVGLGECAEGLRAELCDLADRTAGLGRYGLVAAMAGSTENFSYHAASFGHCLRQPSSPKRKSR